MKYKSAKKVFLIVIAAVLLFWIISFARCEFLTFLHKNNLENNRIASEILGNIEYYKVLKYSKTEASVYYVTDNRSRGNIITYKIHNGNLDYNSWDTVWSVNGNADNTIWPYWWHFFYSHPHIK